MNPTLIFGFAIGLGALMVALGHVKARMKELEETVARANSRRCAQVERIKRSARGTLKLARDLRALSRRKSTFEMSCHDLEGQLSASKLLDKRIYVVDERKAENEQCFIVRISNADYAVKVNSKLARTALESWRHGRRYIIWAPEEKKARERLAARFPELRGFHILSIEPFTPEF